MTGTEPQVSPKRVLWLEIGAVMCVFVLPQLGSIAGSLFPSKAVSSAPDWAVGLYSPIVTLCRLAITIFILWGSGEALSRFGLRGFVWWKGLLSVLGGIFLLGLLLAAMAWAFDLWPPS